MSDNHEPAHVFRIERYADDPVAYIAADYMVLSDDGITRFYSKPEGTVIGDLVATVFPVPGQFIARLDATLTDHTIREGI